jgi:hypothetical protein
MKKTQKIHRKTKSSKIRKTRKLQKAGFNPFKALYRKIRGQKKY